MLKKANILSFAILALVFWKILPINSPKVANDYHFSYQDLADSFINIPHTWRNIVIANGLGEYSAGTLWSWPKDLMHGVLSRLGLSFSLLTILIYIVPTLTVGVLGIQKLLSYYKISKYGAWVATILFLCNTYLLLLIDGGQLSLSVAYSLIPLSFYLFRKCIDTPNWGRSITFALIVLVISIFDPRAVLILAVLLLIGFVHQVVFDGRKKTLDISKKYFLTGIVTAILLLLIHLYWLLPSFLSKTPSLPISFSRSSQLDFLNFTNLGHSLLLLTPNWFSNIFGNTTIIKWEFALIPILVFLAPILKQKDRNILFWLMVAITGIFLSKGAQPPFGDIYNWLFTTIPGFSFFRDSTKFFFLIALSYSVLIAYTVDSVAKRFPKFKIIFPAFITIYLLLLAQPVYSGKMNGIFSKPRYQTEYFSLADKLEEDRNFGRIFWIPSRAPLGYSSSTHLSVEAFQLSQERPFAIGTIGRYEFLNYIREAPFMGEIFDIAGIRYIAYPYPDERRQILKEEDINYYHTFSSQIQNLPWVEKKVFDFPINTFKTKNNEDHIFLTNNTFYVVGSDKLYWDLVKLKNFELAENALIWAEEKISTPLPSHARVILYEKDEIDLSASFIPQEKFIFPAQNLDFSPNETRWWKRETYDVTWWRDFLQQKYGIDNLDFDYGGGWAVAEGKLKLDVKNEALKAGNVFLARVMESSKGGKVEFWQEEKKIGEIDTNIKNPEKVQVSLTGYKEIPDKFFEYDKADFAWHRIGELVSEGEITVKTQGDINVINSIISVSEGEWEKAWAQTQKLFMQGKVYKWKDMNQTQRQNLFESHNNANVSYQRFSPTRYKVKVSYVTAPITLAFSERYDALWQLNGETAFPLYSLINGFRVEKDGEYDIYFSPQKYVAPGLAISILTVAALAAFLRYNYLDAKKVKRSKSS